MAVAQMSDIPMSALMEQVLPFRSAKYLEDFREKLLGEGIIAPADMLICSKEALETKLSTHASFNFIEMADAISLRSSMDPDKKPTRKPDQQERRGRSRSQEGRRRGGKNRDNSTNGGGRGQRNNSRPHRNNTNNRNRNHSSDGGGRNKPDKPELWAAIERGDERLVGQLLAQGKDPEERHEGWTPLMKASEEGAVEVIRMLLAKKVDVEAHNKKGRTALSFAAAPSFNSQTKTERDTPVQALRLLLQSGADPKHKDERGHTAKEMASKAKGREDAVSIFEEFGC